MTVFTGDTRSKGSTESSGSVNSPNSVKTQQSIRSQVRHLLNTLYDARTKIQAFIMEWTPFLLVTSYFAFSISLYMICTDQLVAIFWWIYLATNFYIAGSTVLEAVMSITPCREFRQAVTRVEESNFRFPTPDGDLLILDLLIVAYLPNEAELIMDRIYYACEQIVFPKDKIRINILYNTPKPIEPLETEMRNLTFTFPQLRIIKVPNSTSKADNLNYFFTLETGADVIAVFDCDHYCHPYGPRWAVERLVQDKEISIVQGRCVIFNAKASLVTMAVAVEFDKIYAVSHPGRARVWGFGIFTGSNGYWRAPLLRELRMNGDMLTEDIDSSLRAFSKGVNTVHDLNVVSYELAPTTVAALWKQRLRWAQGWAQASAKHIVLAFNKPAPGDVRRPFRPRVGIFSLLLIRELSYYLVTQYFCLVLSVLMMNVPKTTAMLIRALFFQYPVAYWLFIVRFVPLPKDTYEIF